MSPRRISCPHCGRSFDVAPYQQKAQRNAAIVARVLAGERQVSLAAEYGISQSRISGIVYRALRALPADKS